MSKKAKKPVKSKRKEIVHSNGVDTYFIVNIVTK